MHEVKAALIGTGAIGKKYLNILSQGKAQGLCAWGAVARRKEAREQLRRAYPDLQLFESEDALYEHAGEFDAVIITTPHKEHPGMALRALQHGLHVLTDKPVGISMSDMDALEAFHGPQVTAVMFHQRMYPKYRKLRELITSGTLGEITRASMESTRYFRTAFYHHSSPWRSSWQGEGGGALMNQGQHPLDIFQWLLGMPETVRAEIAFGKYNDFQVDDEAMLYFRYANGKTGTFFLTTGEAGNRDRLEICGTKGTALLEGEHLTLETYAPDLKTYRETAQTIARESLKIQRTEMDLPTGEEPYAGMLMDFAEAILQGRKALVPIREGMHALELMNAAYLSAWQDRRIALPLDRAEYAKALMQHIEEEQKCFPT